jgi:hypothetical protein
LRLRLQCGRQRQRRFGPIEPGQSARLQQPDLGCGRACRAVVLFAQRQRSLQPGFELRRVGTIALERDARQSHQRVGAGGRSGGGNSAVGQLLLGEFFRSRVATLREQCLERVVGARRSGNGNREQRERRK